MPALSDELSILVDGIAAAIHSSLKKLVSTKIEEVPKKNQIEMDIAGMRNQILGKSPSSTLVTQILANV